MPKSTQKQAVEQTVPCRLIGGDIPVDLCAREQQSDACHGCSSPTRRCLGCGKTRGIADAKAGFCPHCLAKQEGRSQPETEELTDVSLETVLDRVQSIANSRSDVQSKSVTSAKQLVSMQSSPLVETPELLYELLLEHATEKDDIWVMQAPLVVLQRRKHLLPNECRQILEGLRKKRFIQGSEPWMTITLIKTEKIVEVKERLEQSQTRADPNAKKQRGRRSSYVPPLAQVQQSARKTAAAQSVQQRRVAMPSEASIPTIPVEVTPSVRYIQNGPTYKSLYERLMGKSHMVGTERLIGGALAMLQIHFKLSVAETRSALEWFVEQGHVAQKDGWRTVVLKSESVESSDSPRPPTQQVMRLVSSSAASRESKKPVLPSNIRRILTPKTAVEESRKESDFPLDEMITQLEHDLPLLREHRDAMVQRVSALELALLSMQALKQGGSADIKRESLIEATRVASNLLSALHKKT